MTSFHRDPAEDGAIPPFSVAVPGVAHQTLDRGSIAAGLFPNRRGNSAEKAAGQLLASKHFSRNQILHNGAGFLQDRLRRVVSVAIQ